MPNFEVDEAARLLTIADRYFAQASTARALAAAIDQRRISLTTRLDPCVHRHLPEVWSSNAAEISRVRLTRMIARDVWIACEQLLETRIALIRRAEEADAQAFVLQSRAAEINLVTATDDSKTSPDKLV